MSFVVKFIAPGTHTHGLMDWECKQHIIIISLLNKESYFIIEQTKSLARNVCEKQALLLASWNLKRNYCRDMKEIRLSLYIGCLQQIPLFTNFPVNCTFSSKYCILHIWQEFFWISRKLKLVAVITGQWVWRMEIVQTHVFTKNLCWWLHHNILE